MANIPDPKNNNDNDIDLSKFFEKETISNIRPATVTPVAPVDFNKISGRKRQNGLIWVVIVNFAIGAALFSYFIVKTNASETVKPVTMQKIAPPVNYLPSTGEQYMPPLP